MGMFLLVSYTNMVKMLFYMLDHASKAEKPIKKTEQQNLSHIIAITLQ